MIVPPVVTAGDRVVGIGVDVVDVGRMRAALERTPGLALRTFSDAERREAAATEDGGRRLACSFAAKEAVVKALGAGISSVRLAAIELLADDAGFRLALAGPATTIATSRGVATSVIRIGDRGDHVVAAVVLTTW